MNNPFENKAIKFETEQELNQIQAKMVLAGVMVEMLKDAYTKGWQDGFRNGTCRRDGNYSRPNRAEFALEDFDNYLNNIK